MSSARDAYNRGNLDEAERLAKQADQSSTMWNSMSHLWGDSPSKVLRDVSAARAMKSMATASPKESTKESSTTFTALKTFMGKNDNSAAPGADKQQLPTDNTEKGRQML